MAILGKNSHLCYASSFAKGKNAYVSDKTKASSWLVRMDSAINQIDYVGAAGQLHVVAEGTGANDVLETKNNVVRPAMWITQAAIGVEHLEDNYDKR